MNLATVKNKMIKNDSTFADEWIERTVAYAVKGKENLYRGDATTSSSLIVTLTLSIHDSQNDRIRHSITTGYGPTDLRTDATPNRDA